MPLPAPSDPEPLTARLWMAGARGVWERPTELVAWFDRSDAPVPDGGVWTEEPDRDWQAEWKATIAPVHAGRVVVVPSWLAQSGSALEVPQADDGGPITIVLDPGRAFGTGHHATTVGCLLALQALDLGGRSVLDVGTGTGILAIAAARLGAGRVVAVDTDADAVAVARDNIERVGVDAMVAAGSVSEAASHGRFDVVVANLLTESVIALTADLVAATQPGGSTIVSGIGEDHRDRAVAALRQAGANPLAVDTDTGWVTVRAVRRAPLVDQRDVESRR